MRTVKDYKKVLNSLNQYTTHQEKNVLLKNLDKTYSASEISRMLGAEPISEFEAFAFIFKMREISVSDILELTHSCDSCGYQDFIHYSIPEMFFQYEDDIDNTIPIGLYDSVDDLNDENINNMTIDEYNGIESIIYNNNLKIFNPEISITCKKCGITHKTSIGPLDIVSKFSISNIYEQYSDISYYSSMTKYDTDNMYPFEREIFMGLIQKKEDKKEGKKAAN